MYATIKHKSKSELVGCDTGVVLEQGEGWKLILYATPLPLIFILFNVIVPDKIFVHFVLYATLEPGL